MTPPEGDIMLWAGEAKSKDLRVCYQDLISCKLTGIFFFSLHVHEMYYIYFKLQ